MGTPYSGHIILANVLPEWRRTGMRYAPPVTLAPRASLRRSTKPTTADDSLIARICAVASSGAAPPSHARSYLRLRHVSRVTLDWQQPREHPNCFRPYCPDLHPHRGESPLSTAPLSSDTHLTVPMPPAKVRSSNFSSPRKVFYPSRSRACTMLTDAAYHNGT